MNGFSYLTVTTAAALFTFRPIYPPTPLLFLLHIVFKQRTSILVNNKIGK